MVSLRPIVPEDRERMLDILTSHKVNKTYMLPDFEKREDAAPLFHRLMDMSQGESKYVRAIDLDGGLIGFVGLLVPHIARILFGGDNRLVVPASALLGAIALLICDLIGRLLFAPFELHVGIVLSVVGGIYFIFLILHRKGGRLS